MDKIKIFFVERKEKNRVILHVTKSCPVSVYSLSDDGEIDEDYSEAKHEVLGKFETFMAAKLEVLKIDKRVELIEFCDICGNN